MITQGSLKHCIAAMLATFQLNPYQLLSIIHNPRAKYYSLLSAPDLEAYQKRYLADRVRLVCTVSLKELKSFINQDQTELPLGGNIDQA